MPLGAPGEAAVDVHYFLHTRIEFIRGFYKTGSKPFLDIKRKIENSEPPYIPSYSEDGEPPFLAEWLEADESVQVFGYMCVSMLSTTLKLYFQTWESELGIHVDKELRKTFRNDGWLHGYSAYFSKRFGINFSTSGVNLLLLEETVLARNMAQHPDNIASATPYFSNKDIEKLKIPAFTCAIDRRMSGLEEEGERGIFPVSLHVTGENLELAITETGKLNDWLNREIYLRVYKREPNRVARNL